MVQLLLVSVLKFERFVLFQYIVYICLIILPQVQEFLKTLHDDLQSGVGSRLDSLLGQCMYFGLSFSRVGCDFRGLMADIFQSTSLRSFCQSLDSANER